MTKDNWITVAAIISAMMLAVATLTAPALAEIIKFRLIQPNPTPKTSKPKPEARVRSNLSFRSFFRLRWRRYIIEFIVDSVCLFILIASINSPTVTTSREVVLISLAAAVFVGLIVIRLRDV